MKKFKAYAFLIFEILINLIDIWNITYYGFILGCSFWMWLFLIGVKLINLTVLNDSVNYFIQNGLNKNYDSRR